MPQMTNGPSGARAPLPRAVRVRTARPRGQDPSRHPHRTLPIHAHRSLPPHVQTAWPAAPLVNFEIKNVFIAEGDGEGLGRPKTFGEANGDVFGHRRTLAVRCVVSSRDPARRLTWLIAWLQAFSCVDTYPVGEPFSWPPNPP